MVEDKILITSEGKEENLNLQVIIMNISNLSLEV